MTEFLDPKLSLLVDDNRTVQEIAHKPVIQFRAESSLKSVTLNCVKYPLLASSSVTDTNSVVEYCLPGTSYQKHFDNYSYTVFNTMQFSL